MNNTEKLLRAFIEASGYEVEEVTVDRVTLDLSRPGVSTITMKDVVDYKVTKKPYDLVEFPFNDGASSNSASKESIKSGMEQG